MTNERLASTTHGETLDLVIHNVSSDFHKTLYECEVNFLLPSGALLLLQIISPCRHVSLFVFYSFFTGVLSNQ